jgi:hypothetical protein
LDFDLNIYYDCEKKFTNDIKNFNNSNSIIQGFDFGIYVPSEYFISKTVRKVNVKNGQDVPFYDKKVFLDWDMFKTAKHNSENFIDVVIELIPHMENTNNKVAFYTLCKFYEENK